MTDMERVLKRNVGKVISQKTIKYCNNTVCLVATTYEYMMGRVESRYNTVKKIYSIEVIANGNVVLERFGKDKDEMNKVYLEQKMKYDSEIA